MQMNLQKTVLLIMIITSFSMIACNKQYTKTEYGMLTVIDSTITEIQFYSPEIVRIVKYRKGFDFEKNSLSVIKEPQKVSYAVTSNDSTIIATTGKMTVKLNIVTGTVSFASDKGEKLLTEKDNGTALLAKKELGEPTFAVKQAFELDKDEYIYGLGQYQKGKMSQRNQELKMVQEILETAVPFMLSNKGYGLFWDNYSPTVFKDNPDTTLFDSEIGDCIDYYFMVGANADGVIANMRDLTGKVPMMPYWTYGYWQSKERYKSQDETVGVVKKYRELGVPIDGIIQDWQYWGGNDYWNAMEFLNPAFPDPQRMIDEVHDLNAHIIISCWASFGSKTSQYTIMKEKGMLMNFRTWPLVPEGDSAVKVYDAYHPEARDIYWDHMNKGLFSLGMDGWWLDSSEPDHFERQENDLDNKTYLGSFRRVRNAYPIVHVGGIADHQKEINKNKRVFILTRSAFAGQQRYAANAWSGDVVSDWSSFRNQISAGLNFSLTGIPYWNSDIGGFFLWLFPGGYQNKAYHELYVRWMQFGAFCPMMRSHGTDTPRELWYYGKEGDWAYDALKKMIELRYRLLPYIYATSWDVSNNHSTMMRALMMDFANDKKALDINNQYMFGKNILVCPVTEPMYVKFRKDDNRYFATGEDFSTTKSTEVYLPAGTSWFDFWTGSELEGGQTITREAPIDMLPLYVKAGSIIPFGPEVQYANEKMDPLTVLVYPGADASFTFYDDERDNYNYEEGMYATMAMNWNDATQTLTIEAQNGEYKGMPESRKILLVKVGEGKVAGLPLKEQSDKEIMYTGDKVEVKL
jgi:alpha-D-xyloside xylohydrolase